MVLKQSYSILPPVGENKRQFAADHRNTAEDAVVKVHIKKNRMQYTKTILHALFGGVSTFNLWFS